MHAPSTRTSARSDAAHTTRLLWAASGSCPTPWPRYCHDNLPSNRITAYKLTAQERVGASSSWYPYRATAKTLAPL